MQHSGSFTVAERHEGAGAVQHPSHARYQLNPLGCKQLAAGFSEEFANRKRADEMPSGEKVKNFRPKTVGWSGIEYTAKDLNPDDVPF
jgi:hypothetical protein